MITKLNLTIDRSIIEESKTFAQEKNKSVSRIVEDYLKNISAGTKQFTYPEQLSMSGT